jgi:hypothetical protein
MKHSPYKNTIFLRVQKKVLREAAALMCRNVPKFQRRPMFPSSGCTQTQSMKSRCFLHVDAAVCPRCHSICRRENFKTYISSVAINYLHFTETERSLPGSQKFVTRSYPEAEEPSLCPPIVFFMISCNSNLPSSLMSSKRR